MVNFKVADEVTSGNIITFLDTDDIWAVNAGVSLVSTGGLGAVSSKDRSTLINNGTIVSAVSYAAELNGADSNIVNTEGHSLIGITGVKLSKSGVVDNVGLIIGHRIDGVWLLGTSRLDNSGEIYGRERGVDIGGTGKVDNTGEIRSDAAGISISTSAGVKSEVNNLAGGVIKGGISSISVVGGALKLTNRGGIFGDIDCVGTDQKDSIVNSGKINGDVFLGSGNDTFNGKGGTSGQVFGEAGTDKLTGGAKNDRLDGGAGDDRLAGGLGNDRLTGGNDKDKFVFDTKLNAKTNVDTIVGFSHADDTIVLDRSIFKVVSGPGTLKSGMFKVGSKAADGDDRIVYNKSSGELFYDRDGAGGVGQVLFAKLAKNLNLAADDFVVVA